jgi:hypothetical protein
VAAIADNTIGEAIAPARRLARALEHEILHVRGKRIAPECTDSVIPLTGDLHDRIGLVVHDVGVVACETGQHVGVAAAVDRVIARRAPSAHRGQQCPQ